MERYYLLREGEMGDLRVMKKKTHYFFPCVWRCGGG
jgi:hypothetical protein